MNTNELLETPNMELEKKWKWDRNAQDVRKSLVEHEGIRNRCEQTVTDGGDAGASITTALNDVMRFVTENNITEFLNLDRTNQRLVVRKILHGHYKAGTYDIVDADSPHRTGKKGKTKNYIAKSTD